MEPILSILIGTLIALLKVAIEYSYWSKKKNEDMFHGTGFSVVFCILVFLFVVSDYNSNAILIVILSYWNVFELTTNITHNKELFYVGKSANFDKVLRRMTNYVENLKFVLHIITIIFLIFIIFF